MLEGYDKDWVDAGGRRTAFYTNISPGSYTFKVKARNSDGVLNEKVASLKFHKQPYFYETTWFYSLLFFLFSALLYFLYRIRTLKLMEKIEEFVEIVDDNEETIHSLEEELNEKYSRNKLDEETANQYLLRLSEVMAREKLYRVPSISPKIVAGKLNISTHNLSQILNCHMNQNFRNYINSLRIEEVKKMLTSPDYKEETILSIAMEAGFKSKSSFNFVFKKMIGETPAEYRKKLLKH